MTSLRDIKLYSYWRSSSAWRVRIALELKHLSYELSCVNLLPANSEQLAAAFEQLNPLRQIPVLEALWGEQALRITQSLAILDLLEQAVPSEPLYPATPRERAWAFEAAQIINAGMQPLQNIGTQALVTAAGADAREFSRGFILRGLRALEAHALERGGAFSVGETVSIADVLLVPQLYAARRLGIGVDAYPTLAAIEQRCAELPAFIQAHPANQPDRPASQEP